MHTHLRSFIARSSGLLALGIIAGTAGVAAAQTGFDPYTGQPYPTQPTGIDPYTGQPYATQPYVDPGDPSASEGSSMGSGTLVCTGDWRFPLTEVRQEIGPARFARQRDLQRELVITAAALGYCEAADANKWADGYASAIGPCSGLLKLAEKIDFVASNLFRPEEESIASCLTRTAASGGECEGVRGQLTNLRTYDQIIVDRAELVLSYEVCTSPERGSNSTLRNACVALEDQIAAEVSPDGGMPGQFGLAAPMPFAVSIGINKVSELTDGRFLSVTPENFVGVRRSVCQFPGDGAASGLEKGTILERDTFMPASKTMWGQKRGSVMWSMCNELGLADVNASSCRAADIYIDERGELHLNKSLTTRKQRKNATLCVDVSDFHPDQPLMVTVGLDATGSVPERVWPGETMHIGTLLDQKVTRDDVLSIRVFGKGHGVSLAEVLRINGVTDVNNDKDEACRMARSWVPVVDHEVPVGDPDHQVVVPMTYNRGRVGETQRIEEGDSVILWIKDIEPNGSVMVEYAAGQYVGYQPPPMVGEPDASDGGGTPPSYDANGQPIAGTDPLVRPGLDPDTSLSMRMTGVDQPLLPRRARYPGSRVLRLGTPKGNHSYPLRVCTKSGGISPTGGAGACSGGRIIVDEKLFVHGAYYFGLRMYFGYTSFPTPQYAARPLGGDEYEVVQTSSMNVEYDVAVLLAAYPFGRDPRSFSHKPWKASYWKGAALLAGFGLRRLSNPWEDFYMGASLPVANGVSLSALAHVAVREVALDVRAGDTFSSTTTPTIEAQYPIEDAILIGASIGLSFDYDLFERAFTNIWDRVSGKSYFTSTGTATARAVPDGF